ncbi:GntR family transcriptional regulator [Gorillibacterium sp. sgz5001074]|uniref:GntR family transcriptional regulator n=1 Tax=Gorillibacterium sp. sgz5001074 TaxID=3446695 RepID=UPI003F6638C1
MQPLDPLVHPKRVSLGEQVYESLRGSIVSLRLAPGQMIYENELAAGLGVSRTPVREAIRLLVSEELLEVLPQRGTRVTLISLQKVAETRFIREQLETGAFRFAARHFEPDAFRSVRSELDRLLREQQEAAEADDSIRFLDLDEEFHRVILASTGNRTLLATVNAMRGHLNRVRYLALSRYHHMAPLVEEHRTLLAALEAREDTRLPGLLEVHFNKLDTQLPQLARDYPQYFKE